MQRKNHLLRQAALLLVLLLCGCTPAGNAPEPSAVSQKAPPVSSLLSSVLSAKSSSPSSEVSSRAQYRLPASSRAWDELPEAEPDYSWLFPELTGPGFHAALAAKDDGTLYLTFDDGPSKNTPKVLDLLDEYGIKATFFVVPNNSAQCAEYLREIHRRGHTIGVHSRTHEYTKIYAGVISFIKDFKAAYDIILRTTGERPVLFRFPGGSNSRYSKATRKQIVAEMTRRGFTYFDWNVSAQDAQKGITAAQVYDNVMTSLGHKSRGVVLMHDSAARATTVEALPRILDELQRRGYRFDRLNEFVRPIQFPLS